MKQGSTLFLKTVIIVIGIAVLTLCIFVLPMGLRSENVGGYLPILLGMYIPAIPFFVGLFQGFKILNLIDKRKAFSEEAVNDLKIIKCCGAIISVLYGIGMPYIFMVAQWDDAPGVVLIGLVFVFASAMVAIMAAILQKLFQDAIEIKLENELTV
jgi:hypothetical protein